jgi:alkylation response protein AidB-like acyl-CoA dehydrogenase
MRFTAEQQQFATAVAAFCARECATLAQRDALTDGGAMADSPALLKKFAELGWLGISLPERYGGAGAGFVEECLFLDEAMNGLAPMHAYVSGLTAAQTYLRWGTEEQKHTVVGNLTGGRCEAIALSEPEAGSDLAAVRLQAARHGDGYLLNGHKTWITGAHLAEHLLVLARTDASGSRHEGLTLLMVPRRLDGIEIRRIDVMQPHTVNDVFFTDVRVPVANVVGEPGAAWKQLTRGLGVERVIIAAMSVGAARRSLADLVAYVRQRHQFGRPIGSFQAVRHRIADVATEIAVCRSFLYEVAAKIDSGDESDLGRESSMAKVKCSEVAKYAALEAMQLTGGFGYARESGIEGQVRESLVLPIFGGANEIQRDIIGKSFGL